MNKIPRFWVRMAMVCMGGCVILAVAGVVMEIYSISFLGVFLAFITIWMKLTKLVCPHCGEQKKIKPVKFMHWNAQSEYHCPRCGMLIEIED